MLATCDQVFFVHVAGFVALERYVLNIVGLHNHVEDKADFVVAHRLRLSGVACSSSLIVLRPLRATLYSSVIEAIAPVHGNSRRYSAAWLLTNALDM